MGPPKNKVNAYSWNEAYNLSQLDPHARRLIAGNNLPELDPIPEDWQDWLND